MIGSGQHPKLSHLGQFGRNLVRQETHETEVRLYGGRQAGRQVSTDSPETLLQVIGRLRGSDRHLHVTLLAKGNHYGFAFSGFTIPF